MITIFHNQEREKNQKKAKENTQKNNNNVK